MTQQINPFDTLLDMEKSIRQMSITLNSFSYAKFLDDEQRLKLENLADDIAQIFFRLSDFNESLLYTEKNLLTSQPKGDFQDGKN